MRTARAVGLALALLLVAGPLPGARAATEPAYPDELLALLPRWLGDAATLSYMTAQSEEYLDKARAMEQAGRFRVAMFDLETHRQLVDAGRLMDETADANVARQKDAILRQAAAWHAQAQDDWRAYRDELHALDDGLKSLHAAEIALYSADMALSAAMQLQDAEGVRIVFARDEGVDPALVAGLVRTSRGVSYQLSLARDVLGVAQGLEGLPPRLDEARWRDMLDAVQGVPADDPSPHLRALQAAAGDATDRGEKLLGLAVELVAVRQTRIAAILQQYGDAQARGEETLADAATGLRRALENVTAEPAQDAGLLGVFTVDARDQAAYTLSLVDSVGLGNLAASWATIDEQAVATAILADAAGARAREQDTPGPAPLLACAAVALAALVARRARR